MDISATWLGKTLLFYIRNWSYIATHLVLVALLLVPVGATSSKSLRLRRFKSDRNEMWPECSSTKYASINGVGFLTWRQSFKMAAMKSFQVENCRQYCWIEYRRGTVTKGEDSVYWRLSSSGAHSHDIYFSFCSACAVTLSFSVTLIVLFYLLTYLLSMQ